MDVLLFVGVAVAWAAYLLPKALHRHEDAERARPVMGFSDRLRVLASREPVSRRRAELVVPSDRTPAADATPGPSPAEARARREASLRATGRRRRVLSVILLSVVAVAGAAALGPLAWVWVAAPVGLLAAWLVACRVMVKGERQSWQRRIAPPSTDASDEVAVEADPDELTITIETKGLAAAIRDAEMWDPVPVTLPTYVTKPTATRSVRTIDLDDTGVWTSGRTAADSALAREADAADQVAREARAADGDERAVGSAG